MLCKLCRGSKIVWMLTEKVPAGAKVFQTKFDQVKQVEKSQLVCPECGGTGDAR